MEIFHIAQVGGIQLLTQFANQQGVVFAIFRTAGLPAPSAFGYSQSISTSLNIGNCLNSFTTPLAKVLRAESDAAVSWKPLLMVQPPMLMDSTGLWPCCFAFACRSRRPPSRPLQFFLSHGLRINIPAANAMSNVDVRLEITPRIKESWFIFDFCHTVPRLQPRRHDIGHHFFMETGHANEAEK